MITYKDIVKENNPILREKSKDVPLPLSNEDIKTLEDMNEYLIHSYDDEACTKYNIRPGVGLSAVQIGVLKRMFAILGFDEEGQLHYYIVINPKIIAHSEQLTYLQTGEGCLSVDREVEGYIHRPKRIRAKCYLYDLETNEIKEAILRLEGYIAVVFQHEYDHLEGRLFIDHIQSENPFYIPNNSSPIIFPTKEEDNETT